MMKLSTPLKAFTILEMMAGLTIAAMVVSLGFYGLQLVMGQYLLFQNTSTVAADYRHTEALLWHDIASANWVERSNDTLLTCTRDSSSIYYLFHPTFVLRQVNTSTINFEDTLKVQMRIQDSFFEGINTRVGLVDLIVFSNNPYGETHTFPVRKIYSAEARMKYEKKHEH